MRTRSSLASACARVLAVLAVVLGAGDPAQALTGGADDCASAELIPGAGQYAVSTTGATLGSVLPPCGTITKDVWFRWTPTQSGTARINTCYFGAGDTLIAVYAGAGCPTQPAIACSDDYCPPRSEAVFLATAGATYTIQIGAVGATDVGGQILVSLNTFILNDECSIATPISGLGSFPVTNVGASSGSAPTPTQCDAPQSDVWYAWTATATGVCTLSTCGTVGNGHTVVAVWAGADCATATYVSCGYATCGLQGATAFPVTAGSPYLFRIGGLPFGGTIQFTGTFRVDVVTPLANDECATPLAISGPGPHPFDLALATTGVQGQGEAACFGQHGDAVQRDLWFAWTAATTGSHRLSTCNVTTATMDTKLVVYDGAGCPSAPAIACNDQGGCESLSDLCFAAVAGATYTFQVGVEIGTPGLAGAFTVIADAGSSTNDDCTTPLAIQGSGPFPFDTTNATAGCAGQGNGYCDAPPYGRFENDVWFAWTATATGTYRLSTCGLAGGADTKVGIYVGGGCPNPGSEVGCSGLAQCGPGSQEARACFAAEAGVVYAIQIGTRAYAAGNAGAFTIELQPALPGCRYDDGSSESASGLYSTAGGVLWMHRFGAAGSTSTVGSVSSAFGSPAAWPARPPNGTPCFGAIWDDPDDDGDPSNAVLLARVDGVVQNSGTDTFATFSFPTPQSVDGVYFVGAGLPSGFGSLPAPYDQDTCLAATIDRAWFVANVGALLDAANLTANSVPPVAAEGIAWLLRADCGSQAGAAVCAGDGSSTPCPCGNASAIAGTGCKHSRSDALYAGSGGALAAEGTTSLFEDQVRLRVSALPSTATALVFQGTNETPVAFGDGLRCASGGVIRLAQRQASGGAFDFGFGIAGDPEVHVQGGVFAPGSRVYQAWFRNVEPYCTPAGFNLTNGLRLVWSY